jgi:hypothetical protein
MNLKLAHEFLTRCFSPMETIALLLRRENPVKVAQRIVKLETALAPRYLRWLAHENAGGANVYVAANPLRSGSRKRTKESIESVRHLYLDLDTDGDARLAALQASNSVPIPNAVVSTSSQKYQVLWQVAGFDFEHQETMLKQLAIVFGGDPACTDRNRVLRIPGFFNCKYQSAYLVTAKYSTPAVWTSEAFDLEIADSISLGIKGEYQRPHQPGKHSHSESDWAWVSRQLTLGKDAAELTGELALRRADKANPLYYAQRTVDVASARQWIGEGRPIEEVIGMLEVRRCSEISAAIRSARAREIAETARRMINRSKTA